MTQCTNLNIASVYGDWLTTTNNGQGLSQILEPLQDGLGNPSPIQISQIAVNFLRSGNFSFNLDGEELTATADELNDVVSGFFPGLDAITIPSGPTSDRPDSGEGGFRLNTDTNEPEMYIDGSWETITTGPYPTRIIDRDDLFNLFVGSTAGNENVTGINNSFYGYRCGPNSSVAASNSGYGASALEDLTSGTQNSAYGASALNSNLTGTSNCAFGVLSLAFATANFNSAFGAGSLQNQTGGSNNVAIGYNAGTEYAVYNDCTFVGNGADATESGITGSGAFGAGAVVDGDFVINIGLNCDVGINNPDPLWPLDILNVNNRCAIRLAESINIPPTPGTGGVIYVRSGHLFYLNSAGTSTQIAP